MASIHCTFFSKILAKQVTADVCLPSLTGREAETLSDGERFRTDRKFRTLVLLHGYTGNSSDWQRYSQVELFAEECGIAVVCPDGNNGHYSDWVCGPQNLTFLQKEFLPAMRAMFPLSTEREDTFVGGLSMGGYGAVKWALTWPETFSHLLNFSGGVDIMDRLEYYKKRPETARLMETVYGKLDEVSGGPNDNFQLLEQYAESGYPLPRLFSACGTEDAPVYGVHKRLMEEFSRRGGDVTEFSCEGIHDFHFWNKALERAMYDWLPAEKG
ncbi:MAG TPA: hypothetical protein H9761_08390 [Candidatus Eisenbergiella merdavium]|uniref:Esterase n=1 Tax=Candidatus Eisenbergiella merdavium TaxID=2838551 RepID=A0A9D2NGB7_9FIRM|nr:hypothetical protein [Candidatus Eisenbergiella merdavium]